MPLYDTNTSSKYLKETNLKKELLRIALENPHKLVELFKIERKARIKAEELSEIDDITELLLNRRGWKKYALITAMQLVKKNEQFSIFFIDLDRLKAVVDTFTVQHGTEYIQLFAKVLHDTLRSTDIKSHPHGDEFFVMLPDTSYREAKRLKKEILKNFAVAVKSLPNDDFFYEVPQKCEVGATIGLSYRKWNTTEREEILGMKKSEAEKRVGAIVKETRLLANSECKKIKKKKKIIRDEARKRTRIGMISQRIRMFRSFVF